MVKVLGFTKMSTIVGERHFTSFLVEAVVAEDTSLFGVAPHAWEDGLVELDAAHPIVSQAEAGDTLSFLRNAGGGGGHSLSVKSFRVELALRPGAIG